MGADLGVVDEMVAGVWDSALAKMKREIFADMRAALPRSEMGRVLMAELAAEEARERASRACHNCVHWREETEGLGVDDCGQTGTVACGLGKWVCPGSVRAGLRTAASCDDYEEVRDA